MGKKIGLFYELDDDEQLIIEGVKPVDIRGGNRSEFMELLGMMGIENPHKNDYLRTIPFLTSKRIILWGLASTRNHGPIARWFNLPLEFIDNIKFDKSWLELRYKIPKIKKGFGRKLLGLKRGIDEMKFLLDVEDKSLWKMHLTKLILKESGNIDTGKDMGSIALKIRGRKECPKCGTESPKDTIFCISCGEAIGKRACECGTDILGEARFCSSCGKEVK